MMIKEVVKFVATFVVIMFIGYMIVERANAYSIMKTTIKQSMNITQSFYIISKKTPYKFSQIAAIAHIESRGNPYAVSPSGAKGLYQFTSKTWKNLKDKHGLANFPDKPSFDIYQQTVMMTHLILDNIDNLKWWMNPSESPFSRPIDIEYVYLAHVAGPFNSFKIWKLDDNRKVTCVDSRIIRFNPTIFLKKDGSIRTKKELIERVTKLLNDG